MRVRRIQLFAACILATVLLAMWAASRAGSGTLTIMRAGSANLTLEIVDQRNDKAGDHSVLLLITNKGPYRICYPDGFFVETRGAVGRAYIPTTNLWLAPGAGTTLPVVIPAMATDWRGVVSYYVESPWNRIKMRLGSSPIGPMLPSAISAVQGAEVRSQWMSN